MTYEDPARMPPPVDWLAELLRSTNFPSPDVEPDARTWWRDLIGQEPETRIVRPAAREWKEEGPFAGGILTLNINSAGIITWTLSPAPLKEVPTEFPTVGRFAEACDAFSVLMRRWYEITPSFSRIAFGAIVLLPVASRAEGYRLLTDYLHHVRIDPEASSDLLYQINRRRRSNLGIEGLEINRLSKWSVAQIRILAQLAVDPRPERLMPPLNACHIELDVNTAPEYRGGFTPPRSGEAFGELVALAREILQAGDRP